MISCTHLIRSILFEMFQSARIQVSAAEHWSFGRRILSLRDPSCARQRPIHEGRMVQGQETRTARLVTIFGRKYIQNKIL